MKAAFHISELPLGDRRRAARSLARQLGSSVVEARPYLRERKLADYPCPVCKAMISGVIVKEEEILGSKRVPALVPAKCPSKHTVALYVDRQFIIRDAEPLLDGKSEGDLGKMKKWMAEL